MSISYATTGRTRQKARTRDALVTAARRFIATGVTPTVEQAADAAMISRATAYRYFPNQRDLLVAAFPHIESASLLGADPPQDVTRRVEQVVDELTRMLLEHEPMLRAMLRLSLESDGAERERLLLRQGRAARWLDDALQPVERTLPTAERRRLVLALRCAVGIEAMVWLRDVAGLTAKQAVEVMRWSAGALLRSALAERPARRATKSQIRRRRAKRG